MKIVISKSLESQHKIFPSTKVVEALKIDLNFEDTAMVGEVMNKKQKLHQTGRGKKTVFIVCSVRT